MTKREWGFFFLGMSFVTGICFVAVTIAFWDLRALGLLP